MEEAGLKATMTFKGVAHKMDYSKTGELLEEKFFFVFLADCKIGDEYIKEFQGGKNAWYTWEEKAKLKNQFHDMKMVDKILESKTIQFSEKKYEVERY